MPCIHLQILVYSIPHPLLEYYVCMCVCARMCAYIQHIHLSGESKTHSSPHQELNLGVSVLLKCKLHVWHGLVNKGAQILDCRLHPVQETLPFLSHVAVGIAKLPKGLACLMLSLSGSNQLKYLTKVYRIAGIGITVQPPTHTGQQTITKLQAYI